MPDASPDTPPAAEPAIARPASPPAVVDASPDPSTPPGRRSPHPAATRSSLRRRPDYSTATVAPRDLALIVLQLALATILVWQFELDEKRHLLWAMLAVIGGFLVNVRLPPRLRPAWFLALSIAALVAILGWADGFLALSIAGALIAAALLPIPFLARVGVVLALGAVFTSMRAVSTAPFWPIVGSMFMFRMISYLHASRKGRAPASLTETAGYFLMLPNSLYPLFPVVDAGTFRDSWYSDEPRTIYQTGVRWISAGLLHLILYRLIKYEVLPSPLAVHTLSDALLYLASNYALYLQVSGHFHLICGMLHLFGWNLPRTHDHYFLAASFSEIWRRINIYWKDFLMKTFFYPAFFWLRGPLGKLRFGDAAAIAVAVLWVFGWTWLAHSWQTFWLLGLFPFHPGEGVMWLVVGVLVAGNAVRDYWRALKPREERDPAAWGPAAVHSLQIMGIFLLVSLFWARWTNRETFRYLLHIITSRPPGSEELLQVAAWAGAIFLALTAGRVFLARRAHGKSAVDSNAVFERQAGWHVVVMGLAVVLCVSGGPIDFLGSAGAWVRRLQTERLQPGEAMAIVDGYYEQLATANSQGSPFLGNDRQRPAAQGDLFSSMLRPRNDLLGFELIPGWQGVFSGNLLTVNRWGMRDLDRTLEKPEGVVRIAFLGSSVVMGYGVKDDETMTRRVEQMLNARSDGVRYEVLNFGSGRYYPVHRRLLLEEKVLAFKPDVVVYVAHQDELRAASVVALAVVEGIPLNDACLERCVSNAQIRPGDSEGVISNKLSPETLTIIRCTYDRIMRTCRERGLELAYVYLPIPGEYQYPIEPEIVSQIARDAGMTTHDLSGWWRPGEASAAVVPDTQHPTSQGQARIAELLYRNLTPAIQRATVKARSPAS